MSEERKFFQPQDDDDEIAEFPDELYQLKYCIPPKKGITKGEMRKILRELQEVFSIIPELKEEVERERAEQGLTKESHIAR